MFSFRKLMIGRFVPREFRLHDNARPRDINVHELFDARLRWRPSIKVYSVED